MTPPGPQPVLPHASPCPPDTSAPPPNSIPPLHLRPSSNSVCKFSSNPTVSKKTSPLPTKNPPTLSGKEASSSSDEEMATSDDSSATSSGEPAHPESPGYTCPITEEPWPGQKPWPAVFTGVCPSACCMHHVQVLQYTCHLVMLLFDFLCSCIVHVLALATPSLNCRSFCLCSFGRHVFPLRGRVICLSIFPPGGRV